MAKPPLDTTPAATSADDAKLKAFNDTVAAIAALPRPDKVDVLRAVANFHGIQIRMESST